MKKALVIIMFLILLTTLSSCAEVKTEVISEIDSPDGNNKVILLNKSSGMTTEDSYQVAIIKNKEYSKNIEGNVFKVSHISKIRVEWKTKNALTIYYSAIDPTVYIQKEEISVDNKNIKIEYIWDNK